MGENICQTDKASSPLFINAITCVEMNKVSDVLIHAVRGPKTGKQLEYKYLLEDPETQEIW